MKDPRASVIICNYNGEIYLKRCINSILIQDCKDIEIIIIDDGSIDKSLEIINSFKDKRIKIYINKKNCGASFCRNIGIDLAKSEICIFLDNDTEVSNNCLSNLLKVFDDKSIGAAQSLLIDFMNRRHIQMGGGKLVKETGWLHPLYQKDFFVKKTIYPQENIIAVSASLAVRKSVCIQINGFDTGEAVVTEDIDFCWRIWLSGFRVVLASDSVTYHFTKNLDDRKIINHNRQKIYFHLAKNSLRSMIKNYEISSLIKYLPCALIINFGRALIVKSFDPIISSFKAVFWILIHLHETLQLRQLVQSTRKYSDRELLVLIGSKHSLMSILNTHKKK